MSRLDDLLAPGPTGPQYQPSRKPYPDGWQPRMEVDDTDGGYVVSKPEPGKADVPIDHRAVLEEFGLDPSQWSVERVRRSQWQRYDGEWLHAVRLSVLPVSAVEATRVDMDALTREIKRWRPPRAARVTSGMGSFVAPMGDTQIGKIDGGGTTAAVDRCLAEIGRTYRRFEVLHKRYRFEQAVLPHVGDCIEGNVSQKGAVVGRTDIGISEQTRVYRRLMTREIFTYAATAPKILVPIVPGNHDETQRKVFTTHTDSWAIEAASAVQDAMLENPDLRDRVRFVFPERDELTVAVDVSGTILGLAHGHQIPKDWERWWDAQAGGRQPIGDADILLVGHLHHLRVHDHGKDRLYIQIPAWDGGSNTYRHASGQASRSRAVSFWTLDGNVHDLDPVLLSRSEPVPAG